MTIPSEQVFMPDDKNRDGPVYNFLLAVLSEHDGIPLSKNGKGHGLRIEFKVNGVDCDFFKVAENLTERWRKHAEESAVHEAREMVAGKPTEALDSLMDLTNRIRTELRLKAKELFPEGDFDEA